jgi:hypothetical protein
MDFFNDFTEVDTTMDFTSSTDTLQQYQVWLFKSKNDNYAKVHIREISTVNAVEGLYLNVLIDYYYQPDGVSAFP